MCWSPLPSPHSVACFFELTYVIVVSDSTGFVKFFFLGGGLGCHKVSITEPMYIGRLPWMISSPRYLSLASQMDHIVNPLKTGVRNVAHTVRSVPSNLVDGVNLVSDKMSDSINKVFTNKVNPRLTLLNLC